ncbi:MULTISPECIES: hypothetical protein [unclassified Actinotalea]|uniref:hypothetical protein n=1 Tax=unclassified Actinotalea TaxID=2638618 RepID=UPI0021058254|nr:MULTISPECIES: hypothetical protein [unclassified Actinotalea]
MSAEDQHPADPPHEAGEPQPTTQTPEDTVDETTEHPTASTNPTDATGRASDESHVDEPAAQERVAHEPAATPWLPGEEVAREPVATPPAETTLVGAPVVEADGIRVGTVVWGLVVAAVGLGLVAFASGVWFDLELALIILVAAAGVALLVGSLLTGRRRRG